MVGVGGNVKWKIVKQLIQKEETQMLCVQETKKEVIEKKLFFFEGRQ